MTKNLTGRDLDAAVAVKLFGWRWYRNKKSNLIGLWPPADSGWIRYNFAEAFYEDVTGQESEYERYKDWHRLAEPEDSQSACDCRMGLPRYSTDWNAMRLVVEEMQRRGWGVGFALSPTGKSACTFERPIASRWFKHSCASLPEAVARAALKTLEVADA